MLTKTNESIFLYLQNITSIVFDGCTNLVAVDPFISGTNKNVFRFDAIPNLTSLSFVGCTSLTGTLDLTSCNKLTSFVSTGSYVGVRFGAGSAISTLQLGSPSEISIQSPKVLTQASVESSSRFDTINL